MTTYYVRTSTGNDANNGTSPATAYKTINKAASVATAGSTIYIGSGDYREKVTPTNPGTSGNPIVYQGDVDGSHTGDPPGEIRVTNFLTNYKTAATDQVLFQLNNPVGNNSSYLTFNNLTLISGPGSGGNALFNVTDFSSGGIGLTWNNCLFQVFSTLNSSSAAAIYGSFGTATAKNWLINNCIFQLGAVADSAGVLLSNNTSAFDTGIVIQNSVFLGGSPSEGIISAHGGLAMTVQKCTILGGGVGIYAHSGSTTFKLKVYSCVLMTGGNCLQADGTGQLVEDYNVLSSWITRSNVAAGAHSTVNYAPILEVGQSSVVVGGFPAVPFAPTAYSPLLGYGDGGTHTLSTDMVGRVCPSGPGIGPNANALKVCGAMELHDFASKSTGTVYSTNAASDVLLGPGDQEYLLAVDAVSTTITVQIQWDANYGAGTKPQVVLVANGEIGVSGQTVTAAGSSGAWNATALSAFTPTGKGVVKIRVVSSAAATGHVYVGEIDVT